MDFLLFVRDVSAFISEASSAHPSQLKKPLGSCSSCVVKLFRQHRAANGGSAATVVVFLGESGSDQCSPAITTPVRPQTGVCFLTGAEHVLVTFLLL